MRDRATPLPLQRFHFCGLKQAISVLLTKHVRIMRKTIVNTRRFFAPQSFPKAPHSIDKQRKTSNRNGLLVFFVLVEMGGVEPPSESA